MDSVRSNNLSLKYQRFTPLSCEDIWITKFEFVPLRKIPRIWGVGREGDVYRIILNIAIYRYILLGWVAEG